MRLCLARFIGASAAILVLVSAGLAQDKTIFSRRNPVIIVTNNHVLAVEREGESLVVELTLGASTGPDRRPALSRGTLSP